MNFSESARILAAMAEDGLLPDEPTELERRRFARLNPGEVFCVGTLLEAGRRAGDIPALSEAIRNAQEAGERIRRRREGE